MTIAARIGAKEAFPCARLGWSTPADLDTQAVASPMATEESDKEHLLAYDVQLRNAAFVKMKVRKVNL